MKEYVYLNPKGELEIWFKTSLFKGWFVDYGSKSGRLHMVIRPPKDYLRRYLSVL